MPPSPFQLQVQRIFELKQRFTAPQDRFFAVVTNGNLVGFQVMGFVKDLTDPIHPGPRSWQAGATQYISPEASDSEVFRLMLSMLIAYEEHEIRETVLVDGVRVFGPHITVDALKSVAEQVEA